VTARRAFDGWVVLAAAFAIITLSIGTLFTRGVFMKPMVGEKVMGTAYGIVCFISCIGMGLGSWAGGVIHDAFDSYQWLFLGSLAIGGTAVILAVSLRPPSPALLTVPAQRLAV
jgi:predicted MFS family arabinose efflux permease